MKIGTDIFFSLTINVFKDEKALVIQRNIISLKKNPSKALIMSKKCTSVSAEGQYSCYLSVFSV